MLEKTPQGKEQKMQERAVGGVLMTDSIKCLILPRHSLFLRIPVLFCWNWAASQHSPVWLRLSTRWRPGSSELEGEFELGWYTGHVDGLRICLETAPLSVITLDDGRCSVNVGTWAFWKGLRVGCAGTRVQGPRRV